MDTRRNAIQSVMAMALALLLPFCCCSLRLCVAACEGAGNPVHSSDVDGSDAAEHDECEHDHEGEDGTPPSEHQHGSGDCDECGCNTHGRTMLNSGWGVVVPAMQLAAVLPTFSAPPAHVSWMSMAATRVGSDTLRFETSLLRQHCALIV